MRSVLNKTILGKFFDIQDAVNVSVLSSKCGLDKDTVADILYGKTKNPGINTITKIADALDCSIDELIINKDSSNKQETKINLARNCLTATIDLLMQQKQKISVEEFLAILERIYIHSFEIKAKTVDMKFAAQCIRRELIEGHKC